MKIFIFNNYQEYRLTIGNADFVFFSDSNTISENLGADTTMHSHKFYEMFHTLRGNTSILTDTDNIVLQEGDTLIISPEVNHTSYNHPGSLRMSIVFTMEKNPKITNSNYYETFLKILNSNVLRIDSFIGSHAFRRCANYFQSDFSEKNELIISCLHEIISLIKVTKSDNFEPLPSDMFTDTNSFRTYIIDDYFVNKFQNGSLENLASLLQLSPQQTQRIIKKMYSQSFSERITMMKMNYAKSLLSDTNLSVTQISEKCGYSGSNGFFVAFKKYYGKTPNELRKEIYE